MVKIYYYLTKHVNNVKNFVKEASKCEYIDEDEKYENAQMYKCTWRTYYFHHIMMNCLI